MEYLIQTIDGKIVHDFSFHLIEAINYHRWLSAQGIGYRTTDSIDEIITREVVPVGAVEFVLAYLKRYRVTVKPKNVPEYLFSFAGRSIKNGTKKDIRVGDFIKSNDYIKYKYNGIAESFDIPEGNYQISSQIEIESEWRVFIFNGNVVGVHFYSGDFFKFPDKRTIDRVIAACSVNGKKIPPAYTLDIGVNGEGTFLIEMHDFFSCGLYGFRDYKNLPAMFSQTYYYILNNY
jgi:hypothetical protein